MSTISFLMASLEFSMYISMSSANCDSFTYSFPIWIPFFSFSCLISVTRSSNTMLNKTGERGHLCLVSDLRGTFGFSPFKFYLFIYLFLVVLGLQCCAWAFSSCSELGLLSNCSMWSPHCGGFSCCRALGCTDFSSYAAWA